MIELRQPSWWKKDADRPWFWPLLLLLSALYHCGFALRCALTTSQNLPRALCVGNAVAGGGGKTPTLLALAEILGPENVVFLTRGFGGTAKGPLLVGDAHDAREVGDEALLLVKTAPTIIARNRLKGAERARELFPNAVILLDDGLQNPTFRTTVNILVWDEFGAGNNRILPAGPLRAPLKNTLAKSDAIIAINTQDLPPKMSFPAKGVIPQAHHRQEAIAFAGIGRPQKFHDSLLAAGYNVVHFYSFADHHTYTEGEIEALIAHNKPLLTTEKDFVRLPPATRAVIRAVPYRIVFEDDAALKTFLMDRLGL